MANRMVIIVWIVALATLVVGQPQDELGKVLQESSGGLPFLSFKNGNVRVNFGGYHAEAGLGGLLSGSGTAGGLHASAGTPYGHHASAGLGGLLNGAGNTGGGLHARAGVGNGGPEAAAGLGGVLDGSSRTLAQGGLYAGATRGNLAVEKRKVARIETVQSAPVTKVVQKVKSVNLESASPEVAVRLEEVKPIVNEQKTQVEVQPIVTAGLVGGFHAEQNGLTPVKSYEKVKISNGKVRVVQKDVLVEPTTIAVQDEINSNVGAVAGTNVYYKKRFRARPHRKVFYRSQIVPVAQPIQPAQTVITETAVGGSPAASAGVSASASAQATSNVQYSANGYKTSTLFDDIFNIPISTLTAVNQLLNNKAG